MTRAFFVVASAVAAIGAVAAAAEPDAEAARAATVSPATWLARQPRPAFRPEHTLPPLTRWGWSLDFETRVEFATHWGYCLELAGYLNDALVDRVLAGDPKDPEARVVEYVARDPQIFRLQVLTSRQLPDSATLPPEAWTHDAEGRLVDGQAKSLDGNTWTPGMSLIYSPEAPESVWEESGRLQAEPLARLRRKCPITMVLNGGEYGMAVPGWGQKVWERDPRIVRAKGARRWADYVSAKLARSQFLVAEEIRRAVPDRILYVYYPAGGVPHRLRSPDWKDWCPGYDDMKPVSDVPNAQTYYKDFNDGWIAAPGGRGDLLTQALNARAQEISVGMPLSYNWLCGGYKEEPGAISDPALYVGFLKMYYTAGMLGGNAGYYSYPQTPWGRGFEAPFPAHQPPPWIQQMVALARVHAQFSFLEHYLREGDLLPGPDRHRWSKDLPAYELPTGDENARVVARRLRAKPQWLITAWAADGRERIVSVTIPELGTVRLLARGCGTVHKATRGAHGPIVAVFDSGDPYWLDGTETPVPPLTQSP